MTRRPFDVEARLRELCASGAAGRLQMRITADGRWHYQGSPIERPALVKLFATALHRAPDGSFWLVTPHEDGRVEVEDAPFVIVACKVSAAGSKRQVVRLETNVGNVVELGPDHPLTMRPRPHDASPAPYVTLRPGIEARLLRPVFYELVEIAELMPGEAGGVPSTLAVASHGQWFTLGHLEEA